MKDAVKRVRIEIAKLQDRFDVDPFSYDLIEILHDVEKTCRYPTIQRNIDIYKQMIIHDASYQTIIDKYDALNCTNSVNTTLNQVRNEICRVLAPKYKQNRYQQLRTKFAHVEVGETADLPEFHYYTVQSKGFVERDFVMYFDKDIKIRDYFLRTEIKKGREFGSRIILHIWNLFNQKTYTIELLGYLGTLKMYANKRQHI